MPITALPTAPNKATDSASSFNTKANLWVAALDDFVTEANALETNVNAKEVTVSAAALTATAKAAEALASASAASVSAASAAAAPGTNATSSTSLTMGLGSKSLTIQISKSYVAGMKVVLASTASPTLFMYGTITSYDSGTGALVVEVESTNGSSTLASWNVSLSGPRGISVVPPAGVELTGGIVGMVLSNNTLDANKDIDISAGACMSSSGAYLLTLTSAMTKRIDAAWSSGSGSGGMLTGSAAGSKLYHVYGLYNPTTGATDVGYLLDGLSIATYLPSGYTAYRWLCFVLTDASVNIRNFRMIGNDISFVSAFAILTGVSTASLTLSSIAGYIPAGRTERILIGGGGGSGNMYIGDASTEAQYYLTTVNAAWAAILSEHGINPAIAEVNVTQGGAIYINTGGSSKNVYMKSIRIIR